MIVMRDTLIEGAFAVLSLIADSGAIHTCELPIEGGIVTTDELIDDIIRREGGFVDHPADSGGPTNYGITQRSWRIYRAGRYSRHELPTQVKEITETHAREFYRDEYVEPSKWIEDDTLLAFFVDTAINHGTPRATRWTQRSANVMTDGRAGPITRAAVNAKPVEVYRKLLRQRLKFIADIVARDTSQAVFLRGWVRRVCEFI